MEPRSSPDPSGLTCEDARALLSAAADDELAHDQQRPLAAHLEVCDGCAAYADELAVLTRAVRVRAASADRAFVDRVMARAQPARLGRGGWLRPALAGCGAAIALQSLGAFVFADADGAPTHVARHLGAFALALAVGLLYAAWRPHRAHGLLPLVAALVATNVLGAVLDTLGGERAALSETTHAVEVVGLVVLWMAAGSPGWGRMRDGWRSFRSGTGVRRATTR